MSGHHPDDPESQTVAQAGRSETRRMTIAGSYPIVRGRTGEHLPYTRAILERLVTLYETWGKEKEAVEYQAHLEAAGGAR